MKEVTEVNQTKRPPFFSGREFDCTISEAEEYVNKHCIVAKRVDEVYAFGSGILENKVWWNESKGGYTEKIAHYNSVENLLIVYKYK